jgi:PKD repeat protein
VGSVAVLSGADIVISNDFESYDVGTFPSAGGWILWFSGAGSSEQFVTDAVSVSPSKSFRMKGAWGWAANAARYFTATSNMIGYETYVRVEQATGVYYSAAIGFSKRTSATTSNWYAAVWFEQDSTIRSGGQVLQTYEANRWYRIKVVLDKATNTYDVWIDNQLKGDDLQTQNSHEIEAFSLAAEWSGVTVYYDDVKVFQIVADPNIVNPTFVADVAGDYVLELTVDDGRGGTDSDQVMITAVANQVPTCNNINATTDEDSFIDINLSLHCTDPDGDPLTGSFLSDPPNGTAQFLSPTIRYTPDPNFYGADSFTYRVTDGQAESNTATVNVTINPVNDPPVADDQSVSTSEDTAVNITLNGSDIDGDPLTFSTVTNPGNGTLSGTPPNVTYMPNPDFNGTDSFTFQVNDGQGGTDTGTVSITVTPVNDAPVCNDINVSTDEDMPVDIPVDCSDVEGDVLTGSFLSDPPHGTAQFLSPIIRYTPDPNFYGADSFTYRVTDGELESNTATVNVTINEVNDPPVADFSYFPEKPTTLDTIQFTDQSTDLDGNIVSWSWDFGDGNFSTQQNPIHRYDDDGTYTVSLTVTDDERAPNTTTKQVVVANIAPTAAFSFSPVNPTTWDSVQFTDQSTDPDDPIQLWHWDFGDGNTSTQQNPAHRYDNPGTYTVSLTVTDDDEDSAIATQQLEVSLKQGDINNDRAIDLKDAMLAAEFALGLQTPTAFQQEAADVTPPLGVIDVRDAVRIAEVALGIRNGFSLPSPGAGAPISTSSHSTPAKLHLESLVLSVGGRGVLRILADKIAGLQAGPVGGLKFDPKVIRVRSIRGVGHVLLASKIDNKAGKAVFLFVSVRGTKKVKEGAIIELEIEAVGHAGESTFLELEVDMAIDLKGQGVKPMTINGSVTLSEPAELRVKEVRSTPNPASSAVRFIVIGEGIKEIQVQIYDLSGRMVFMSGWVENGFVWHLQNNDGKRLANGVYLYIVTVRGFYGEVISKVGKLVILR